MSNGRLFQLAAAALASLALGGCASTNPSSLIPESVQATVVAEDRLTGAGPGGKPVSVDEMLSRARSAGAEGTPAPTGEHAAGAPSEEGQATAAAGASAGAQAQAAPQAARAAAPPPVAVNPSALPPGERKPLFEVMFDGRDDVPPAATSDALSRRLKSARLPAKTEVTILVGPGPGTTAFDQALLANKRARNVRSLLPQEWVINQVYDPTFPSDTVRIVLGPKS